MQWVCSKREKQDGLKVSHREKLVIKGSKDCPRSDNSITAQGNLKVFLATAANEGFDIVNFNIRNGYMQGGDLKREVLVEPLPEYKNDGMI